MAQTKKKSIFFVAALVVLAALIVILATTLSACSGDEDEKTEPTPTETVQPEATTEPASADAATVTGSNDAAVSGSNSTAAKQPTKSSGSSSSSAKNDGGSKDNGRDKVDYIKNYGDNVEKGVEGAADDFVGSLKDIGKAYDKGDIEGITNTVEDFSKGLGDFLGGIKDSIVP